MSPARWVAPPLTHRRDLPADARAALEAAPSRTLAQTRTVLDDAAVQTLEWSGAVTQAATLSGMTQDAARDALRSVLSGYADPRPPARVLSRPGAVETLMEFGRGLRDVPDASWEWLHDVSRTGHAYRVTVPAFSQQAGAGELLAEMRDAMAEARALRRSFVCVEMSQDTMDDIVATVPMVPAASGVDRILGLPIFIDDGLPRGAIVPRTTYPARGTTTGDPT